MCQATGDTDGCTGDPTQALRSALLRGDEGALLEIVQGHLSPGNDQTISLWVEALELVVDSDISLQAKISTLKSVLSSDVFDDAGLFKALLQESCLLHLALESGVPQLVQLLLDCGCNPKSTCSAHQMSPLHEAARAGNEEIVDLLLRAGSSADAYSVKYRQKTPLLVAIEHHRKKPVFRKLLAAQKNNNSSPIRGDSGKHNVALLIAAREGNLEALEVLLEHGRMPVNWQGVDGDTALIVAAAHGQFDVVQCLLSSPSCNPNLQNSEGQTALHNAATTGVLKVLIQSGANIDITDNFHQTALFCKVNKGETDAVALLLQANCHMDICDHRGVSPAQLAVERGHRQITAMLALSGAELSQDAVLSHNAFHNSAKEAVTLSEVRCLDIYRLYYNNTLKALARVTVRSQLRAHSSVTNREQSLTKFQWQLECLELPNALKKYLQLSDVDILNKHNFSDFSNDIVNQF